MGYQLEADELLGLGRYMMGMMEKWRGPAKLGAEEVVVERVAAAAEEAGREK